ncbi:branched-chain amino acid ABC transporter [Dictyobacter alpinus]|uniref:Branched-chain amino acid ABC transporter n=1 Tax=Dictyobacter alpinus TaxID=2014873 RepID=A0A402BKK5_9CHLR|nr:AzlD domain-containing protein [Dictyobacter alpinus]GCE31884.1 branched-chain amino acid ABC transporter [Dictyobacter alpinus]
MSQKIVWITIIVIGIFTFATRLSFIGSSGKLRLAPFLQQALRFVPVAALSALILPDLFLKQGHLALSLNNARLCAGIIAIIIAWRTKNVLLTVGIGMASLWLLQALLGLH